MDGLEDREVAGQLLDPQTITIVWEGRDKGLCYKDTGLWDKAEGGFGDAWMWA